MNQAFSSINSRRAPPEELFDEAGGINSAPEIRVLHDGLLEGNGRLDAGDHVFGESAVHAVNGLAAVFAGGDELADHRVVGRRNGVAGVGVRVHAPPRPPGW